VERKLEFRDHRRKKKKVRVARAQVEKGSLWSRKVDGGRRKVKAQLRKHRLYNAVGGRGVLQEDMGKDEQDVTSDSKSAVYIERGPQGW